MVFGMGQKEASEMLLSVQEASYREALKREFASGRLKAAESKAAVLNDICFKLNFPIEKAQARSSPPRSPVEP